MKKKIDASEETAAQSASIVSAGHVAAPTTTATPLGDVPAQLQAIETSCNYGDPLADAERRRNLGIIDRVPSTIVARVLALAARGNGSVAGITIDTDAAKAALAKADQAEAIATSAAMLARRAQDEAIRQRTAIAIQASAVRMSLRGFVKTEQGQPLASENDELRSLAKRALAARKARKTKTENAAAAAASATETAPVPAPGAPTTAPKAS